MAVIAWLWIGCFETVLFEEDPSYHFFLKARPTLRFFFYNPYGDEYFQMGDEDSGHVAFDESGVLRDNAPELTDYLTYCKYRYGIASGNRRAGHLSCRQRDGQH